MLFHLFLASPSFAASARPDERYQEGTRLLDEGRWSEALPIYRELTRSLPDDGWCWMGLGWSLHYTGDYAAALPAYRRALALGGLAPGRVLLEMARCEAARGKRAAALDRLDDALRAGLPRIGQLKSDARLASLRGEPRFRAMVGEVDTLRTDRVAGWRHDLRFLGREAHRLYPAGRWRESPAAFDSTLRALSAAVPRLDDDAMVIELKRLLVRLGDGHTRIHGAYETGADAEALPLLFTSFDDGMIVTAADSANVFLLGARVDSIDGRPIASVLAGVEDLCPRDNPVRVGVEQARLLRYPRLLRSAWVAGARDRVRLAVTDRDGAHRSLPVAARRGPAPRWVREGIAAPSRAPAFARRRTEPFWMEFSAADSMLFLAYNAVADDDTESVEAFAGRVRDFLDTHAVERLVVDLRWNGGGDLSLNPPLLEAIVESRRVNRPGHLFVIAGRQTFSAAMSFAAQLERFTHATFVGEPTGSSPNFVGETQYFRLPWSGLDVTISNLYWQNSVAGDARPWIAPRIPVAWRFGSWREGRDDALEAVRATWQ